MYNAVTLYYWDTKMLEVFIHTLEVALLSLLALLTYRIHSLHTSKELTESQRIDQVLKRLIQGNVAKNIEYDLKMESLKKAQTFAGIQLFEIKRSYGDLHDENLAWLREAISLYLIGAIDFIGKQEKCGAKSRKELITLVLKSNLQLSPEHSTSYFKEALYRKLSSDNDLMVRAGAKAAKTWLNQKAVPRDMSLSTHLDNWGVFA